MKTAIIATALTLALALPVYAYQPLPVFSGLMTCGPQPEEQQYREGHDNCLKDERADYDSLKARWSSLTDEQQVYSLEQTQSFFASSPGSFKPEYYHMLKYFSEHAD